MRRIVLLLAVLAVLPPVSARADLGPEPHVVVALIDTGINPYSPAFRDDSARARQHPSTYIPGYPEDAERLDLTLDPELAYSEAFAADEEKWDYVFPRTLYWIPGTKIVGLYSFASGGRNCAPDDDIPPANAVLNTGSCREHVGLDDHGHGTMTASRAAGVEHSLSPEARVVMIEGLGDQSTAWAGEQAWIDVQSNSWGSIAPGTPAGAIPRAFKAAAKRQLVFAASGNGLALGHGIAPQPTQISATGAPGVIIVGAHDNGRVSPWSSSPAHVVADGYGGYSAFVRSRDAMRPHPGACCTSAASPYAAGGGAQVVLAARRLLGDDGTTPRAEGVLAIGHSGAIDSGPLSDGELTVAEARAVLLGTAEARPKEGADDGLMHFLGGPRAPQNPQHGPGENPFCEGCFTLPVRWEDVPQSYPAHKDVGYGAVNERTMVHALEVLRGAVPLVARPDADAFFARDADVRRAVYGE